MKKNVLISAIVGIFIVIFGAYFLNRRDFSIDSMEKIEVTEFENKLPDYKSSYYIDAYNNNSTERLKENFTILVKGKDEPIYVDFAQVGSTSEVLMKIYFDFKPIQFKTEGTNFLEEHIFEAQDGMKIKFPVYFGEGVDLNDEKTHKLFITFTSIPNEHILNYNRTTDFYGVNAVYDITKSAGEDYSDNLIQLFNNRIVPKNNFEESFGTFILNTDYENEEYELNKGIKISDLNISAQRESSLPLMYNIDKLGCDNVLLLLTVGYKVNNEKIVMLDGENGTANGSIEVTVPEESGLYEVIAYAIYNPFDHVTGENHLADCSYRFTLSVN